MRLGPRVKRAGVDGPLTMGDRNVTIVSKLVSYLDSDPRGVQRPIVERNKDVAFFKRKCGDLATYVIKVDLFFPSHIRLEFQN